jgi:hypothetical protein
MFLRAEPIIKTKINGDDHMDHVVFIMDMNIDISVKIIDTDFEETVSFIACADAIVDVYERRGLNVAANLAIYLRDHPILIPSITIYKWYAKYADEVEKYLTLA